MDHPLPWLRFVDASDLDDDAVDFDGMNVESPTGEHLGDVDGFIVDSETGRPYYVAVDSGGWFKSKHFLLPVGHIRFDADPDGEALITSLSRDRIDKFPGFDKKEFEKMSEADIKRLNDQTCAACTIEGVEVTYQTDEPMSAAWNRSDFRYPDWWHAEPSLPDRMGASAITKGAEYVSEQPSRREWSETEKERETVLASADKDKNRDDRRGDVSPHFDGRAQPGDVIGIETGGERTFVGDTTEDENKRRRDAEEATRKKS